MPLRSEAIYSKSVLNFYDAWVLGFSNTFLWKCPTSDILEHFNQHLTINHLDVGVGTGYFLDHASFSVPNPRIVLIDLNENSLKKTTQRIQRYHPTGHLLNVLEPIHLTTDPFDSISLNYLLHCLPGNLETKSNVFKNLKPLLNPGGVIFGTTILKPDDETGWMAKQLMNFYNRRGIFSNLGDDYEFMEKVLSDSFHEYHLEKKGCVALFYARN